MVMEWLDLDSADSYTGSHAWQPDMLVTSQSLYEELLEYKDKDKTKYKLGIPGADIGNLPVLVLHVASAKDSHAATRKQAENPRHHWFEDPINPGVLRSFIQRLVVSQLS